MHLFQFLTLLVFLSVPVATWSFPSVCHIVKTSSFRKCLQLKISSSMCGLPPRPCARFNYHVPQYFIEVTDGGTFFKELPPVKLQLQSTKGGLPIATEEDEGTFSYHAHVISVPFAAWVFNELPCGGALWDKFCFLAMSEHLGRLWKTGEGDLWQPAFLAWGTSPKACLLKGAVEGIRSGSKMNHSLPANSHLGLCSLDRSWLKRFPPSKAPVCSGWGIHFPRYATVNTSDATTASLVIASRIKSLGAEVFRSIPSYGDEKWQMIYPKSSSCFQEGQNIGRLRLKGVNEMGRLSGKIKNYLYVIWKPVNCTRDAVWVPATHAWLAALKGVCLGLVK